MRAYSINTAAALIVIASTTLSLHAQDSDQRMRASFGHIAPAETALRPTLGPPIPQADGPGKKAKPADGTLFYPLQLTPPDPRLLFVVESEGALRERLRQEARERGVRHRLEFPGSTPPPIAQQSPYFWRSYTMTVEPSYVISRSLFWEQRAFERYGVSLGVIQPGVSTGLFLIDTLAWPVRRIAHPFWWYQMNTDCYSPYFSLTNQEY